MENAKRAAAHNSQNVRIYVRIYFRFYKKLQNMKYSKSFISIYALLLSLSISLVALHTLRNLALKKDISIALLFQKQSLLYAKSLKNIALACLKRFSLKVCQKDSINFDSHFSGTYAISEIQNSTNNAQKTLILDIMIYANTLLSTHPLHHSARFIINNYADKTP